MAVPQATRFTYRAFISYSHRDKAWTDWLHRSLETYRVPSRLVGTRTAHGVIPRRLNPIFRDREELASAAELGRKVNAALAQSENLIVLCSPAAAASRWVNEEVLTYKRMGRGDRIFCLIVDGEPDAWELPGRADQECFCPALRFQLDGDGQPTTERTEPIAADARPGKDGKQNARLKLIAGMLDVGFDALVHREAQRRRRRMLVVTTASVLGMAIATGLAITAYVARNEARQRQAQTEDALNFMLGDLHDKLDGMGRLDLMASVTDKAMALFANSKPGSLTDTELTEQSRALVQIGEIRLKEIRLGPAMDAFRRAYQRSAELTARHPGDGRFLYDRAQAEYWIGDVYWRERQLDDANAWLTRYRDSTLALLKIDPRNKDWQLETTYGQHNLAVLALERGNLDAARQSFQAELKTQRMLLAGQPGDAQLTSDVADTISWLGSVAEQQGDLAEAQRHFHDQVHQLAGLRNQQPNDFRWLAAWANAQELLAASLGITGRKDESLHVLDRAAEAYQTLTGHDPNNVSWRIGMASVRIRRVSLAFALDRTNQSASALSSAMQRLHDQSPSTATQDERYLRRVLSRAWLLRAEIALRRGDLQEAMQAATSSLTEARYKTPLGSIDDDSMAAQADAMLVQGNVQQMQSPGRSPSAWAAARALLATRAADSRYWRILDPWLRLCRLTGDVTHARIALDRLNASGYVPLQPWPESGARPVLPSVAAGDDHAQ